MTRYVNQNIPIGYPQELITFFLGFDWPLVWHAFDSTSQLSFRAVKQDRMENICCGLGLYVCLVAFVEYRGRLCCGIVLVVAALLCVSQGNRFSSLQVLLRAPWLCSRQTGWKNEPLDCWWGFWVGALQGRWLHLWSSVMLLRIS